MEFYAQLTITVMSGQYIISNNNNNNRKKKKKKVVISIALYLTDKGEHTALYKINNNVDFKISNNIKTLYCFHRTL